MSTYHFSSDDLNDLSSGASAPPVPQDRRDAVAAAVSKWQRDLADLSGRNTLLYFKDLRVSTLDLAGADPHGLRALLDGEPVRLSQLYPAAEDGSSPAAADPLKRVRAIRRKAIEFEEERGLNVAHVAVGMASWDDPEGSKNPAAPIVLRHVTLEPLNAAHRDFTLALEDSVVVNPVFVHFARSELGVALDQDHLDEQAVESAGQALRAVDRACATVPGWSLDLGAVRIANFQYAKQPLVEDLTESVDLLAGHDLVAALVGDDDAIASVRGSGETPPVDLPDHIPPDREFLVLDADSSQSHAINAVLRGSNLVIQGPPGTGKSQTIANLMASLIAEGKTVLFVAEKRAAIDAVLTRLEDPAVDLGHLVMDLHDGGDNRRRNAQALADSLNRAQTSLPVDRGSEADQFRATRDRLTSHKRSMHEPRDPWDVSVFEAQSAALPTDPAASPVRVRGSALRGFDRQTTRQASQALGEYADLGGFSMRPHTHPWVESQVENPEQARQLDDALDYLTRHLTPHVLPGLEALRHRTGLRSPESVVAWGGTFVWLERVRSSQSDWQLPLDEIPVEDWVAATAPRSWRSERAIRMPWRHRRALVKTARSQFRDGSARTADVHHALVTVAALREECTALTLDGRLPQVPEDLDNLDATRGAYEDLRRFLDGVTAYRPTDDLSAMSPQQAANRVEQLWADRETLRRAPRLNQLRTELRSHGLADLLDELTGASADAVRALATFDYVLHASVLEEVRFLDHEYGTFSGAGMSRAAADYAEADREHIASAPARVRHAAATRLVEGMNDNPAGETLVRRESAKKRKLMPMRRLWQEIPDVLLRLRPAWAMSPLVVSQVLPRGTTFDVVIFDEASQVLPADAMPSIMRARQVVIAGDVHQLPPTTFFSGSADEDEDTSEDAADAVTGFESLLDLARTTLPERTLTWHYRSRDERLIAFSNAHIYHGTLTTFPGVHGEDTVRYVPVAKDSYALGGNAESSAAEVEAVVEEILRHARTRPTESLGVIAFGIKHADRVDAALRDRLSQQPAEVQDFFAEGGPEPFFVKNLERVQGDERDAIILTVGYGKTADGRVYYRFGPLNMEGGERRLNVAVTRAKRRITVVSALSSHDLDPHRLTKPGAQLLRQYLQFAESQGTSLGDEAWAKPDLNPFELDVLRELTTAGIPAVPQYGASGYRIDFALQHPTDKGRMVLALEADGATYHRLPTARDRDRLRQQHLENLGWHFHRIWSTDWFRDREAQVAAIEVAYQEAVARCDTEGVPSSPRLVPSPSAGAGRGGRATPAPTRGPKPHVPPGYSIAEYSPTELEQVAAWVRSDNAPRTDEEIIQEMMEMLGFRRRGKRIEAALRRAARATRNAA